METWFGLLRSILNLKQVQIERHWNKCHHCHAQFFQDFLKHNVIYMEAPKKGIWKQYQLTHLKKCRRWLLLLSVIKVSVIFKKAVSASSVSWQNGEYDFSPAEWMWRVQVVVEHKHWFYVLAGKRRRGGRRRDYNNFCKVYTHLHTQEPGGEKEGAFTPHLPTCARSSCVCL